MLFKYFLFLLLFSASERKGVIAKIAYNELSNKDSETFEDENAEENLMYDAIPLHREKLDSDGSNSEDLFQSKFEKDDENEFSVDDFSTGKTFVEDEENLEAMERADDPNGFDAEFDNQESHSSNTENRGKDFRERVSSSKKFTRGDENNEISKQASLHKRKSCDKNKLKNEKYRGAYATEIKRKTDTKEERDCPTRTFQSNAGKSGPQKKSFVESKKGYHDWSDEQLSALSTSLSKIRDDSSEFENLKNILYDMGLINNSPVNKRHLEQEKSKHFLEKEKREITENEDEDMTKNDIVLRRNEAANENIKRDTAEDEEDKFNKRETVQNANEKQEESALNNSEYEKKKRSNMESRNAENDCAETDSKSDVENNAGNEKDKFDKKENYVENSHRKTRNDVKNNIYEKRMEDQIQAKIEAIKEKVKREIKRQEQVKKHETERKKKEANEEENSGRLTRKRSSSRKSKLSKKSSGSDSKKFRNRRNETLNLDQTRRKRTNEYEDANDTHFENEESNESKLNLDKRLANDVRYESSKREGEDYDQLSNEEIYRSKKQKFSEEPYEKEDYQEELSPESENVYLNNKIRKKRRGVNENQKSEENENAAENEYFGALPETYDGESNRYKRIRRDHLEAAPEN